MTETDIVLRGVLAAIAFTAVIIGGAVVGNLWHARSWPLRCITLGCLGVLVYVLAGQVKAYLIGIPFDGFSWVGVAAYVVLLGGSAWHLSIDRRGR